MAKQTIDEKITTLQHIHKQLSEYLHKFPDMKHDLRDMCKLEPSSDDESKEAVLDAYLDAEELMYHEYHLIESVRDSIDEILGYFNGTNYGAIEVYDYKSVVHATNQYIRKWKSFRA